MLVVILIKEECIMTQRILLILLSLIVSGCVSLDDFKNMSALERANYICPRNGAVKKYRSLANDYEAMIVEQSKLISKGYKVHKSCQNVEVKKQGSATCKSDGSGQNLTTTCDTPTHTSYQEICMEIPVPINIAYEREQLEIFIELNRNAENKAEEILQKCYEQVYQMSAEQAYEYYRY